MALHETLYVSLATRDMAQPDLLALLDPARFYNEAGQGAGGKKILLRLRDDFLPSA